MIANKNTIASPLRIFLSYDTADRDNARVLRNLLEHHSRPRISSMDSISVAEDWRSRLREEIANCDVFIMLLTPNSIKSDYVPQERGAAWALGKPILIVKTHPELSPGIQLEADDSQVVTLAELEDPAVLDRMLTPNHGDS